MNTSSIDQQFVEYVVRSLVSKPDAVQVERTIDEKGVLLQLTVHPEDLGRVIGKRGATAQSLRTLLRALGTKNDARYNLKIIDNGEGGHMADSGDAPRSRSDTPSSASVSAPTQANDDVAVTDDEDDSPSSARLKRTREELQELDDLDV